MLRKIIKSSSVVLVGKLSEKTIAVVYLAILARVLGTEGFGAWSLLLAFAGIFASLFGSSVGTSMTRYSAEFEAKNKKDELSALLSTGFLIICAISLIPFLILTVLQEPLALFMNLDSRFVLVSIIFLVLSLSIFELMLGMLRGLRMFKEYSITLFIKEIGLISSGIILLTLGLRVAAATLALILSVACGSLLAVFYLRRAFRLRLSFDNCLFKKIIKLSMPLAISVAMVFVLENTDKFVLAYFTNIDLVGIYSAAFRITYMLVTFFNSISAVLLPFATTYITLHKTQLIHLLKQTIRFWASLIIPLSFFAIAAAKWIIQIVLGEEYIAGTPVFMILITGALMMSAFYICYHTISALEKTNVLAVYSTMAVVINIILDIVLVQWFKEIGVAAASVTSTFFVVFILFAYLKKRIGLSIPWRTIVVAIIASLPGATLIYFSKSLFVFFAALAAAFAIYGVLFVGLRGIKPDEIGLLANALNERGYTWISDVLCSIDKIFSKIYRKPY